MYAQITLIQPELPGEEGDVLQLCVKRIRSNRSMGKLFFGAASLSVKNVEMRGEDLIVKLGCKLK